MTDFVQRIMLRRFSIPLFFSGCAVRVVEDADLANIPPSPSPVQRPTYVTPLKRRDHTQEGGGGKYSPSVVST